MEQMNTADLIVWSAMFARTNMGQSMPTSDDIRRYRIAAKSGTSLPNMVNMVCAEFIETDEHMEMFLNEAKGWEQTLRFKSVEYVLTTWYEKRRVWEEATK